MLSSCVYAYSDVDWIADKSVYCYDANTYLGQIGDRYYYKTNDGSAISVLLKFPNGDTNCAVLSTVLNYTDLYYTGAAPVRSVAYEEFIYNNQTWYINIYGGMRGDSSSPFPTYNTEYNYSTNYLKTVGFEIVSLYVNDNTNSFSFVLEVGSVAYIEYAHSDIEINMNTVMPELSTAWIAGKEPDFWPSSQSYFGNDNSLPVINDSFTYNNWNRITWSRGEPRNIVGQTKNAVYSDTIFYGGVRYLTVYNYPYYLTNLDKAEVELSGPINITVTNAVSVTVYTVLSGTINGVSNSIISNNGDNVSTEGQYTDQNGQIVIPSPGSGNFIPENSDLESVLTNLVTDIDTFFTGTWRHIRQMVTSAGKFPSVIVELYSWLPDEYKAVLFSAFGIVIVVGILKVML